MQRLDQPRNDNHYDITGTVDVGDPAAVCEAVRALYLERYPEHEASFEPVARGFFDFARLYQGLYPGYHACDTEYHNLQHIMDVTLCFARLLDGHEESQPYGEQLGPERAALGLLVALFHDSGYIRTLDDTDSEHGAEYTAVHVSRSANFLSHYLEVVDRSEWIDRAQELVHYTGYERTPEMDDPQDHRMGCLLGTADLIAQMSDRAYLEKCRDHLYKEFKIGGVKVHSHDGGGPVPTYQSPDDLLHRTPDFMRNTLNQRLDGLFGQVYRYAEVHFGGENPYLEGIEQNYRHLAASLAQFEPVPLRRSTS